jgi:ATP-dependent helicase/nuclease subunit A
MREPLDSAAALDPTRSIVVEACAGSGKTWLLVSRMIRLLLAGAAPSELLAITFTRKAAQEMTDRLHAWLRLLALGDDAEVRAFLRERHIPEADIDGLLPRARGLLEAVLTAQPGPTVTTFHGWFLDLLKRAPLESALPWGAQLLERTRQLQDEVRDRLLTQWAAEGSPRSGGAPTGVPLAGAADTPGSPEGAALQALLADVGEHNLRTLLKHFLDARAEWWAYTQGQDAPVDYALDELRAVLGDVSEADPDAAFWTDADARARAAALAAALESGGKAEAARGAALAAALAARDLDGVLKTVLTSVLERRVWKPTKALQAGLGARLESLRLDAERLENRLFDLLDARTRQRIWRLNRHGLRLGHALLGAYQDAKVRLGLLDFADAEWLAAQLLQDEDALPALALKLDARARHLLLDEFQDTNPLQWQALAAWLATAHGTDSGMTVFLVGDPKQAIYRFRRGEARVFDAAARFLADHFGAPHFVTDLSRRLAPAVVAAINPVFADLDGYAAHAAAPENRDLPGAVRALPVQTPAREAAAAHGLSPEETPIDCAASGHAWNRMRNPLTTPRAEADDRAVHEEARLFARTLADAVLGRWGVTDRDGARAAQPGDVMALVRKRTHLHLYERALEEAGVPFIASRRGGLLHALEAQDLIALVDALLLPHADLKLAHTLKSPLFACDDAALLAVFAPRGASPRGWERLHRLAAEADCPPCLARAARLLAGWRAQVGRLPAHDLLDRIYFEGDLEARYAAAVPPAMRPQVAANLRAFMQLALTQDAGRYPTLAGFVRELATLVDDADAAPGEGVAADGENAVRLLTIHGAKGLEAPIVWLLGGSDHDRPAHHAVLAPWPPEAARPLHFSLYGNKDARGAARAHWFDAEDALARRESDNLLYVALTRTRQALIVSGDANRNAWLDRVCAAWDADEAPAALPDAPARAPAAPPAPTPLAAPAVGQRLVRPADTPATRRGELFHACLEAHAPPGAARDLPALAARLRLATDLPGIEAAARALIGQAALAHLFDPARYRRAHNELALIDGEGRLHRVDRVVEHADAIWLIDYKTGEESRAETDADLAARHRPQLAAYHALVAALWPGRTIRAALLLADGRLVDLQTV